MNSMHQNHEDCNPIVRTFASSMFGDMRVVEIDGEPWFVAADVCAALDLTNTTVALDSLDEDERSKFNLGRQGEVNLINEPGLYSLVLRSRKPEAKAFKRWVCHEVLPAIRKTGIYINPVVQPDSKNIQVDDGGFREVDGSEYARVSYAKTLRTMARSRLYSPYQRMMLLAKAAHVLSGEPVDDLIPVSHSTLRERVLLQVDKYSHTTTRDIYTNLHGCNADISKNILQALEEEGVLVSTVIEKPNGRHQKVWTRRQHN